jgi:dTDP-glucose pyrophosphorylase
VLDELLDTWKPWTSEVFVVAALQAPPLLDGLKHHAIPSTVVVQPEPDGTLNALMLLADSLREHFIVVLGDCLVAGHLSGPSRPFRGVGVWDDSDEGTVSRNYSVRLDGDLVREVEEKPRAPSGALCGMGLYFLDREFLDASRDAPKDQHGRREMTDALQFFISRGGQLQVARLRGEYVNINTPVELDRARRLFGPR